MAENSKIEWTTHTFNPWRGCTKVSPGCKNCYAEKLVTQRLKGEWGPGAPRTRAKPATWAEPLKWNRQAERDGIRPRVFCASLADWLDDEVPVEWLYDLLALIHGTPHLDWLLLTKRPQNWRSRLDAVLATPARRGMESFAVWLSAWRDQFGDGAVAPANVWLGTSVEDQTRADERIPQLLEIPARVRFLSCEPLLGPVTLPIGKVMTGFPKHITKDGHAVGAPLAIHWVIAGGESGPGARPIHPDWARSLRDQCAAAGTAFFFKQWGEWLPDGQLMMAWEASRVVRAERLLLDGHRVVRVGKKAAGRDLDGITHDAVPLNGL